MNGDCGCLPGLPLMDDICVGCPNNWIEEDMLPHDVCGNCLGDSQQVTYDARSGRRLCIECEPYPQPFDPATDPMRGRWVLDDDDEGELAGIKWVPTVTDDDGNCIEEH